MGAFCRPGREQDGAVPIASLYLLVIIGWVFTTQPDRHFLTMPLLVVLHLLGGIAAAGVTLTVNTLALRVAPEGRGVPFSGVAGIATSLGSGTGPIIGGVLADFFSVRSLNLTIDWISPGGTLSLPAVALSGFDFLFGMAFLFGLLSLNLLVALREEGEIPGTRPLQSSWPERGRWRGRCLRSPA